MPKPHGLVERNVAVSHASGVQIKLPCVVAHSGHRPLPLPVVPAVHEHAMKDKRQLKCVIARIARFLAEGIVVLETQIESEVLSIQFSLVTQFSFRPILFSACNLIEQCFADLRLLHRHHRHRLHIRHNDRYIHRHFAIGRVKRLLPDTIRRLSVLVNLGNRNVFLRSRAERKQLRQQADAHTNQIFHVVSSFEMGRRAPPGSRRPSVYLSTISSLPSTTTPLILRTGRRVMCSVEAGRLKRIPIS